jgi:hypothetical protein
MRREESSQKPIAVTVQGLVAPTVSASLTFCHANVEGAEPLSTSSSSLSDRRDQIKSLDLLSRVTDFGVNPTWNRNWKAGDSRADRRRVGYVWTMVRIIRNQGRRFSGKSTKSPQPTSSGVFSLASRTTSLVSVALGGHGVIPP